MDQTTFVELLTGETFLYDQSKENIDFYAEQAKVDVDPKYLYKVMTQQNNKGEVAFGFLRLDNDVFPPSGRVSVKTSSVLLAYDIDPNSDLSKGFEDAKLKEGAKKVGLQLVK